MKKINNLTFSRCGSLRCLAPLVSYAIGRLDAVYLNVIYNLIITSSYFIH